MFQPIIKDIDGGNLLIGHSRVIQISYRAPSNQVFTKDRIKQEVEKLIRKYKGKKNLMMMVSVDTPFGFRSGKAFSTNSSISLPEDYEWDDAPSFVIFVWEKKSSKGGNDPYNDCLFNAVRNAITTYRLPKCFKTPESLKEYLEINRDDKIDITHIPKIEKLYRISINVSGDYYYTSPKLFPRILLNLLLIDGHYTIDDSKSITSTLLRGIPKRSQHLVLCLEKSDSVELYDGTTHYELSYEEYFEEKRDNKQNAYINRMKREIREDGMEQTYDKFMEEVEALKVATEGRMDLARSGFCVSNEALKAVYYSTKYFQQPDPLTRQEQHWILNSTKGAIIFHSACQIENAYSYDKNSAYPAAMIDNHFSFPICEGEYSRITELPNPLPYGVYRVEIKRSRNEIIDRLFRFNETNHYTHFDIQTAQDLNLEINLIIDDEANSLAYPKRGYGSEYFRQIINQRYDLRKNQGIKLAKRIVNSMWGALAEKNKIKRTTRKQVNLNNGETILSLEPLGNEIKVCYVKDNDFYKHDYARLGTFLLAKVRRDMVKIIFPYNEHIKRFHTDGFISDVPIPSLKIGNDLGDWKLENTGRCFIKNSNNIIWEKN
jgi:hypothetical protein